MVYGTFIGNDRMLIKTVWGGKLIHSAKDLGLMTELVLNGTYEPELTGLLLKHAQPGMVTIDVGANVGLFTLLLAQRVGDRGRVLAYEANPSNLALLRENVAMNYYDDRIEIVPRAAAASETRLRFRVPERFVGHGSIMDIELPETELLVDTNARWIEVEAEPLDRQVGRFERIDIVKIDVEGGEEQVFAGMEQLLNSGIVQLVTFELVRKYLGDDWEAMAARLRDFESRGWAFGIPNADGTAQGIQLDAILERGWWGQILLINPGIVGRD